MKKVCIINANMYGLFCPESTAPMGGAELDMYNLAKGLKHHYKVSVITGDWGQNDVEDIEHIIIYKSFKLKNNLLSIISAPFVLLRRMFISNADVYISSGAGPEVGIIAFFCRINRKKFVYRTASEIDCNKKYINSHGIRGLLYAYGIEHADIIVTSVKSHIGLLSNSHPIIRNRIIHVNLGININKEHKIEQGTKSYILWVGRCSHIKNPELFIKIAENNPGYKFVMICPKLNHENKYFCSIKEKAIRLSNLKFIDYVPFRKIQPYFDRAKLFINTSDFEGFTYTLIQCGLAKTPIAYLNVNPDNVITRFNIGEYGHGNINIFTKKIMLLLKNKILWKKKSNAIYEYVVANHNINELFKKWKKLIDDIL